MSYPKRSSTALGYGRQWRKERLVAMRENARAHGYSHPVCADCGKVIRDHSKAHWDHVVPHRGDPALFAGAREFLCVSCHSRKTGRGE